MDDIRAVGLGVALLLLGGAGCATVHPNFERTFYAGRTSHDLWMNLLTTRYGCDTVAIVADMPRGWNRVGLAPATSEPGRRLQVGMDACAAASLVTPYEVAAWVDPKGIREEWRYRMHTTGPLTSLYFEGQDAKALRVVPPVPRSAG